MQPDTKSNEKWLAVVGHAGQYEVSDLGRVRSLDRIIIVKNQPARRQAGAVLRPGVARNGYQVIVVAGRTRYVHHLVLEAFIGPRARGQEACHANGCKTDNRLDNLRWDSRRENNADRVRHGGGNRGERCGTAKITHEMALEVLSSSDKASDLAIRFGVRTPQIYRIRNGARWAHLQAGDKVLRTVKAPTTKAQVLEACK